MSEASYRYGGAQALVELHRRHLQGFVEVWRKADAVDLALPPVSNPNYASRETLLLHVLRCAASYLEWICEHAALPQPDLRVDPSPAGFTLRVDEYLDAVLKAWSSSLHGLTEEVADGAVYESRWGVPYSIDAMLEHAVMHPIRHTLQLENLMMSRGPAAS